MKHIEKIFDVTTGEETFIERDYTAEEIKAMEELRRIAEAEKAKAEARAEARAALLAQLGITEEQAKLLLS